MNEACGVVGIMAPGRAVSHLVFDALVALQHRGQESAGMATWDHEGITVFKDNGLVASVFNEQSLHSLRGDLAIGHTRYSTSGSANWTAAQPVYRSAGRVGFAIGHNGNLTNTDELAARAGVLPGMLISDSDVLAQLIAFRCEEGRTLTESLGDVLATVEGAYSLVILGDGVLHGVRDPFGFRPLCLGRLGTADAPEGWVLASESPALEVIGASFVRELQPGELVTIENNQVSSVQLLTPRSEKERLCIFEFVYFARPDAYLMGHQVHSTRHRMGEALARQSHVDADLVMGVPDSGVPAAEGFAAASGIPFGFGLVKNRYIGRTFIAPDQISRSKSVRRKLNPLRENIEGRRLVVVDDSIVRGTTTQALVAMLRDAGAREVHLRISSPPFAWPCFYGIDTPTRNELLAAQHSVEEMRAFIGADTLEFISMENLRSAIGLSGECCDACLTGNYPAPVPVVLGRAGSPR